MSKAILSRKIASRIGGYDIFISYRHADAENYATQLHKLLEAEGFIVFRDESEADNLGTSTDKFATLACSSRCLVTIVTPDVFKSTSVYDELSSYLSVRIDKWYRRPFSRVISINVDQTLSKATTELPSWRRLSNFVYEPESSEAIRNGAPSTHVVHRLTSAGSFMNSWRRFIVALGLGILILVSLTAGTLFYLNSLRKNIAGVRSELQHISDSTAKLANKNNILLNQNSGLQSQNNRLDELSNTLRKDSSKLANDNKILKSHADQLFNTNKNLSKERNTLFKETDSLDARTKMLNYRISAMNEIDNDPIRAFRFAEEAYNRSPDQENRRLILSSLSKVNLYYTYIKEGYTIADFKEPYILLEKPDSNGDKSFLVFNMNTIQTQESNIIADKAWIVPTNSSYHILAKTWKGNGMDGIPQYQLFDKDAKPLDTLIQASGLREVSFITKNKASLFLYKQAKILIWDLQTNSKSYEPLNTDDGLYFYHIYGALDTRKDGTSAASYSGGIVLIDSSGNIMRNSYTKASFDMLWSNGKWSGDENFLALNYTETHRLGIWNPANGSFIWLDPDGWVAESYSWSLDGHRLAFSGRTENNDDVIVQVVDADSPLQTRDTIYAGSIPIRTLVFLPGDKSISIADREGNISIVDIATKKIVGTAHYTGITELYSTKRAFYSSNDQDFRVWDPIPAPSQYWLFHSDSEKKYMPLGTVDPSNTWLAVPYTKIHDSIGGIQLRDITTGDVKLLQVPENEGMEIKFSRDSKWLAFETNKLLRIWDTKSWHAYDFPLLGNDRQFIDLDFSDSTLNGFVESNLDAKSDTAYVIDIAGDIPSFIKRGYRTELERDAKSRIALSDSIAGWETGNLYKYQSAGLVRTSSIAWVAYLKCRDQPLGAHDCDVQFVPADLKFLIDLYDSFLWKPTQKEFEAFSH